MDKSETCVWKKHTAIFIFMDKSDLSMEKVYSDLHIYGQIRPEYGKTIQRSPYGHIVDFCMDTLLFDIIMDASETPQHRNLPQFVNIRFCSCDPVDGT